MLPQFPMGHFPVARRTWCWCGDRALAVLEELLPHPTPEGAACPFAGSRGPGAPALVRIGSLICWRQETSEEDEDIVAEPVTGQPLLVTACAI